MAVTSKGNEAKEILRDHYATLADIITSPVSLSQDLFQSRVISEASLREIETEGWSQRTRNTSLLRAVRVAIGQDHVRLNTLAKLLLKYEETSTVGTILLRRYEETFGQVKRTDSDESKSVSLEEGFQFPSAHQILSTDDLLFLCELLKDLNDWEELGLYLGIKNTTLARIQLEKQNIRSRRREMLSCWLKGESDDIAIKRNRSISQIIEALEQINESDIAETISVKILKSTSR